MSEPNFKSNKKEIKTNKETLKPNFKNKFDFDINYEKYGSDNLRTDEPFIIKQPKDIINREQNNTEKDETDLFLNNLDSNKNLNEDYDNSNLSKMSSPLDEDKDYNNPVFSENNNSVIQTNGTAKRYVSDFVESIDWKVISDDIINKSSIIVYKFAKIFTNYFTGVMEESKINKFRRGKNYGNQEYNFSIFDNMVMLSKYKGFDEDILLPDYVLQVPITFIKPHFLINQLGETRLVNTLKLPIELEHISSYMFDGCLKLSEIVIPATVKTISPKAFYNCRIDKIIFTGECVKSLRYVIFPRGTKLYCIQEYIKSYIELFPNIQIMNL